jgi:hypothetical protein
MFPRFVDGISSCLRAQKLSEDITENSLWKNAKYGFMSADWFYVIQYDEPTQNKI